MKPPTIAPPVSRADIAAQLAAQFRHATFNPHDYLRDWAWYRAIDQAPQVTNAMFRHRAKQHGWTVEWLVERVKGEIESPAAAIRCIMGLANPSTVIPYPVLIGLYHGQGPAAASKRGECRCGCGQRVMGRQTIVSDACRKRAARRVASRGRELAFPYP